MFPAKALRAQVIADFAVQARVPQVVAFSCGNATAALRTALQGRNVGLLDLSPGGDLAPTRWWTAAEIRRAFPAALDATSGHLPAPLMQQIAVRFNAHLGALGPGPYNVPTGSGETILCLRWAYPHLTFVAVHSLDNRATHVDPAAPLYHLIRALFPCRPATAAERNAYAQLPHLAQGGVHA